MNSNIWWIGPLVLAVLRLLYVEASLTKATTRNSALVFRAVHGVRILYAIGGPAFVFCTVGSAMQEDRWITGICLAFVILAGATWPYTITLGPTRIAKHVWWRPGLCIPWEEVVLLERRSTGTWRVYGSDGRTIEHQRYHPDPDRFEAEVLKRAKLDRPKDQGTLTGVQM